MAKVPHRRLEADVAALLLSPEVQRIRFVAESVRIGGDGYKAVSHKIPRKLHVHLDPDLDNPGEYDDDAKTITLRNAPVTRRQKAVAVHEATHAVIDNMKLPKSRGLSSIEDEAIAYIAGALYFHYAHGHRDMTKAKHHVQIADSIAKNIIAAGHDIYVVTPHEMRTLRRAIAQDPVYREQIGQPATSNGI